MPKTKPGAVSAELMQASDDDASVADWQRRVVGRSLRTATKRSIDRGAGLIQAAAVLLERANGEGLTVQDVADEAGQSLRTLYQYFESKDDLLLAVFEEAMHTYARLLRQAIADLDDPLERLAGAIIAAARMPERSNAGFDRAMARLRLKLDDVEPSLIASARQPITTLFCELVAAAVEAGQVEPCDPEATAYMVVALNSAYIVSDTLGNDFGLRLPTVTAFTSFCLHGLGVSVDDAWQDDVGGRVRLPTGKIRLGTRSSSRSRSRGSM